MSIFKGAGNGEQIHKKTDEYGNGNTGTGAAYGTQTGVDAQGGTLPLSSSGGEYGNKGHGGQGGGGILHRSNSSSSSSSSSEDDGQGGRRKKSIKEKIKEKLPGGNKPTAGQDAYAPGYGVATIKTTLGEGYGSHGTTATTKHDARTEPEKKGVVEKIKENLPGGNKPTTGDDAYAPGYGAATTKTTPGEGYGSHGTATKHDAYGTEPEKKGVAEKIKEKLPGGHQ